METSRDHARGGYTPYIRTRCPSCQKLFAVDPLPPSEVLPRFECSACTSLFAIETPVQEGVFANSYLIPAEPSLQQQANPFHQVHEEVHEEIPHEPPRGPVTSAVVAVPVNVPTSRPVGATQTCPKCETKNPVDREDCKSCGVVFSKYVEADEEKIADEIGLGSRPELVLLWKGVVEDYDNESRHEEFIMACAKAEALPFASQKYQRILQAAPDEEIARKMRRRIVQIASIETAVPRAPSKALPSFRLPRLNSLIILLGTAVFVFGMMMPGFDDMTGIGFSMVALALGLRFFGNRPGI